MTSNVTRTNNGKRLMAAIAVLALIACAFVAFVPSEGTNGVQTSTEPVDVTYISGTVSSALDGTKNYYVPNTDSEIDATITLSAASTIYAAPGAVISIPDSNSNAFALTVYIAANDWSTEDETLVSGTTEGTVNYILDSNVEFTLIASNALTITVGTDTYGFTATGAEGTAYTADDEAIAFQPSGETNTIEYYNTAIVGNGKNSFNLLSGGSLTIPASAVISGSFSVNSMAAADSTTPTNTVTFNVETVGTGDAATTNFTVDDEIVVGNDGSGTLQLTSGTWTQGFISVDKGTVITGSTPAGEVRDTVGNADISTSAVENAYLFADLATASGNNFLFLYPGTYTGGITLSDVGTNGGAIQLIAGATYSGTVTVENAADPSTFSKYTRAVEIDATNPDGANIAVIEINSDVLNIRGEAVTVGDMMSNSTVTVRDISVDYTVGESATGQVTLKGINLSEVAFGDGLVLGDAVTLAGNAVIPDGETLTFAQGGSIDLSNNSLYIFGDVSSQVSTPNVQILGPGTVYTTDASRISNYVENTGSDKVVVNSMRATYDLSVEDDRNNLISDLQELPSGTTVTINASTTASENVINITSAVSLNGLRITLAGDNAITFNVANGGTFNLTNVTINDTRTEEDTDSRITAQSGSAISVTNSRLYLVVDVQEGASQTISNAGVVYENTTSDVKVGYGTTLTLRDSTEVDTIDVYGTVVITGSVTIPENEYMDVHENATVTVDGTLTILGTATFQEKSETTVNGTLNVGQSNDGGAIVNVNGDMEIAAEGTLNVLAGKNGDALSFNALNAPEMGGDYKLEVYGTFNMRSQFSGAIHDLGEVTINGTSDNAVVVVYEDVSLTVRSVTGTLIITDYGICDQQVKDGNGAVRASAGNAIQIENASNVTVSVSVEDFNYTTSSGDNRRDHRAVMSVSGSIGAVGSNGSSVEILDTDDLKTPVGENSDQTAYITVAAEQTLTLGANVNLVVNDYVLVYGTVNFIRAANGQDAKEINGAGEITVNGTVTVTNATAPEANGITMNAMKYETVDAETSIVTYTYTNFAAAMDAAPTAEDATVYVLGEVTVSADDEVPADVTVEFIDAAELTVDDGVTLTLATDGTMRGGNDASISVDGTFIAQDYTNTLFVTNVYADVVRTEDTTRTWTSLANAINELGWTEIELSRPVVIDEDLTIPAGTTVTTNIAPATETVDNTEYTFSILVYGATLTVEGTLEMQSTSQGSLVIEDDGNEEGDVVVTGTVMRTVLTSSVTNEAEFKLTDIGGVYFTLRQGAYSTYYITDMANAGTIVSATTNLYISNGVGVETYGSIAAQDASFAVAENGTAYAISVTDGSNVSMGTLSLDGGVSLRIAAITPEQDARTMFTGTVSAPYADGTADAVIGLDRVSNVTIQAYKVFGVSTTYGVGIYNTAGYTGDITVENGTVAVGYTTSNTKLTVGTDGTLDVASGATLEVANGMTLDIDKDDTVEIAGTVNVANNGGITGENMLVSGTMNVNVAYNTDNVLIVTGTLNVGENYTMTVDKNMYVGSAPETLGVGGMMSGSFDITGNAYILVYAGADLTNAQIEWNSALNQSDAQTTTYHINDIEYATVYANGGVDIADIFGYVPEGASNTNGLVEIVLTGLDNRIWNGDSVVTAATAYTWYNAAGEKIDIDADIGSTADVYIEFAIAEIEGTISKDAGIILTIDDLIIGLVGGDMSQTLSYDLGVGTHTIAWSERTGYDISDVTVTFNGVAVENGGTITITADMTDFTIIASGAVPSTPSDSGSTTGGDDGMGLTDYLLIVLVVLIVVMAIIVAIRLMRS